MKTSMRKNAPQTGRIAPLLAVATLLVALWGPRTARADDLPPCQNTARLVREAALSAAESDYWLELAKASTIPNPETRSAARKQTLEALQERQAEAKAQHKARLQLCEALGESRYQPLINPADFLTPQETAANPNPYLPLIPGTTRRYQGETEEGTEVIEVRATHETVEILGVTCLVVADTVWLNDKLVEDTRDWFAQDRKGNVWYFGERSVDYEDGQIASLAGSWKAGVDGAKPGIVMPANPGARRVYRQEFALGEAEDAAEVLALSEFVTVPFGSFGNCLKTGEFSPLDPDGYEHKYYARGVGLVLEVNPETGHRVELITVKTE